MAQAIHTRQPLSAAVKELAQAQGAGIGLLTFDEPEHPQPLREIYDPAPLLYVRGNIELLNRHQISIVGSRRPTPYGNRMAERLARDLADREVIIVRRARARRRFQRAQGRTQFSAAATNWRVRLRDGRNLPQGEQENFRGDGNARRNHFGIYDGHVSWMSSSNVPA